MEKYYEETGHHIEKEFAMKVKYEEMTPEEFTEAVNKMPVFIVPTGLLEWHGNHLPLGQDTLKAYGICLQVAKRLGGGIVLPSSLLGNI